MKNKSIFLFICLVMVLYACGPKQPSTNLPETPESPEQVPASSIDEELLDDPMAKATDSIRGTLLRYYRALEAEQIDENQFFSATVKKFYNQTNQERAKIGQSIKNGFKGVENRTISLDESTLAVSTTSNGFAAEFEGDVQFTRTNDKSNVQERFRNRVEFDQNFRITSYEALDIDNPNVTRRLAPASRETIAGAALLEALATGDKDIISKLIHPDYGFYYITRPGAMSNVEKCTNIDEVFNHALIPYSQDRFQKMNCELQAESLPEHDCENFSKEGCFIAEVQNFTNVSKLMQSLNEADLGKFEAEDISKASQLEGLINRQIVATSAVTALYLGEIDGKWYLLLIDTASYDCSA